MKIGIYGDSYAAQFIPYHVNPDTSYIELLTKEYGVLNFHAYSGSSVYYNFSKFLDTHEENDRNIFVKTVSNRLWINKVFDGHSNGIHINSLDSAKSLSEQYPKDHEIYKIAKSAVDYFSYLTDLKKETLFDNLLVEKILQIRPDTIVIDATKFGFQFDCDFDFYNIKHTDFLQHHRDGRHCHLSTEKHLLLYEMIKDCIDNYHNNIDHERLLNVKPSKSLEETFVSLTNYETISYNKYIQERLNIIL